MSEVKKVAGANYWRCVGGCSVYIYMCVCMCVCVYVCEDDGIPILRKLIRLQKLLIAFPHEK